MLWMLRPYDGAYSLPNAADIDTHNFYEATAVYGIIVLPQVLAALPCLQKFCLFPIARGWTSHHWSIVRASKKIGGCLLLQICISLALELSHLSLSCRYQHPCPHLALVARVRRGGRPAAAPAHPRANKVFPLQSTCSL